MSETVIREVTAGVWIFSRPFARFGLLPVGGRSTAIKLQTGDVWVLASTKLDDPTKAKLHELGPVKYIIAADAVHTDFISEFKREFPDAKCIGVEPLFGKRKDIKWDGLYGKDAPDTVYGFEPEIQAQYFAAHVSKDVAFLHAPSKTLIEADLLFNLPGKEQYSKTKSPNSLAIRWSAFGPDSALHKRFGLMIASDKAYVPSPTLLKLRTLTALYSVMRRDVQAVASWDFDRIIPCHGDVIEKDGKRAWTSAYERLLKG
ncbi:hypothetical protein CALCODRAFT_488589 [Calocera cornea HHB12733]|uniref:DUF4336 domain-containing protein n=1 Tax=Calocera cornea HHB12733 TaxID=1353952 RepID=A0A165CCR6_9BASI|nr:hypothetical protein CALCODRAFT_488589 [Calocera cornea HHB12733]